MTTIELKLENQSNESTQTTFIKEIQVILNDKNMPIRSKKDEISRLITEKFSQDGYFIDCGTGIYYFFEKDATVYDIFHSSFEYLIHSISGMNPTDRVFNHLIKEIEYYAKRVGKSVNIKEFSYYNRINNTLYVYNNGNKIIKINEKEITSINNGSEGVVFFKKDNHDEWIYNNETDGEEVISGLLESINYNEELLTKEEYITLLDIYINSLFFPDILSNRPILVFVGEKGSGKSYFFEMLLKVFYGDNVALGTMQSKDDDIKTNLINEYLCIFDNVDGKIPSGKIDLLCGVATGTSIKTRKLYKNNELITTKINTFLGITTRNPYFKRDDLCDRMIIIYLDRRSKGFESSNLLKEGFLENRDSTMSYICKKLQKMLIELKDFKNYKSSLRISDFSNFAINCNKEKQEELENIFTKIVSSQQDLTNSTDSLVILLEYLLEKERFTGTNILFEPGKFYPASELHRIFADFAYDNRTYLTYGFKSVKSLSKTLIQNKLSYKNINNINIETKKAGSNLTEYAISKGVTVIEAEKVFT